ncbi:zinc finger domain-containing protein, partial [Enterococcus faecium]|uniref:zinc finger domain-containing protein n=1 Tax=Enterococcus faecium TaxID=1352 RepID=UPI002905D36D
LDQAVVAGIGNYVVDEALWEAKLSPSAVTADVSQVDFLAALHSARDVALMALARGGVSIRDYKHTDGSKGTMQEALKCYGRAGQPCLRCGTLLEKTKVAGRGTTYCPTCQA